MTEQEYKELTAIIKHSDISLKDQKKLQRLLDNEYFKKKEKEKFNKYLNRGVLNEYLTDNSDI